MNQEYNTQEYNTIDVEVNFSKSALDIFFGFENRKPAKLALTKNKYNKLKPYLNEENIVHNSLLFAIHFSYNEIAKKIINSFYKNKIFDINKNHCEIFKFAIYYNKNLLIPLLVNIGADIHIDDDYALIQYCLRENIPIVDLLIKNGANVYARNSLALIQAAGNGYITIVNLLMKHMENKLAENLDNYQATNYDLALISAAFGKHNDIALLLLTKGANPLINNSEVLVIAAESGNAILVKSLLSYGADPNVNDGMILEKAVRNGHIDVVKVLIEFENNGNYVCDIGADDSAALRWAALKGNYCIVKMLLESKTKNGDPRCDVNTCNNEPHRLATKYGHANVVQLLEEYGGSN